MLSATSPTSTGWRISTTALPSPSPVRTPTHHYHLCAQRRYNIKANGKYSIYQTAGANAAGTWAATDPGFDLLALFPGGFTPRFGSDTRDLSFATGVKGELGTDLTWDLSASASSNRIQYFINETINLSLGSASPTDFPDAGSREQREQNVNADFVYRWQTALANPVNVAFGAEYRREQFRVHEGQYESWAVGPLKDLSPAANGFAGAHPATAGEWASHNTAAYVDFDLDVTERFNVDVAGRFEDYSLFGNTTNGKVGRTLLVRGRLRVARRREHWIPCAHARSAVPAERCAESQSQSGLRPLGRRACGAALELRGRGALRRQGAEA